MRCSKRLCSLLFVLSASFGFSTAKADYLSVYNWDTRAGGSYSFDATNSADGNGSLRLTTTANFQINGVNQDKVAVIFANGGILGFLPNLTDLSLQAYKSSTPSTNAAADFAYRIQFASGDSLVYENAYNGSATVPTDTWRNLDITNGNFWFYDKATNTNFNNAGQEHPLSFYTALAADPIVGLQVAYGSGLGAFDGNVDNITLAFGNQVFIGALPVPLPNSVWGLLALLAILAIPYLKRRRTAFSA